LFSDKEKEERQIAFANEYKQIVFFIKKTILRWSLIEEEEKNFFPLRKFYQKEIKSKRV